MHSKPYIHSISELVNTLLYCDWKRTVVYCSRSTTFIGVQGSVRRAGKAFKREIVATK